MILSELIPFMFLRCDTFHLFATVQKEFNTSRWFPFIPSICYLASEAPFVEDEMRLYIPAVSPIQ